MISQMLFGADLPDAGPTDEGAQLLLVRDIPDTGYRAVYQFTLSTPWDISTATYSGKMFDPAAQALYPYDVRFRKSGMSAYIIESANSVVYQYTLGTVLDISTASYASKSFDPIAATSADAIFNIEFKPDGTAVYMFGGVILTSTSVYQFALGTAWDISTASYVDELDVTANAPDGTLGMVFKPDGTKLYLLTYDDPVYLVVQYNLSTAWDITTGLYTGSLDVSTIGYPQGMALKSDGTRLVLGGSTETTQGIYQYTLSTPWDITTATYDSVFLDLTSDLPLVFLSLHLNAAVT